ncbi:TrbG/VirB9 family P-type conjugative transfer protein, partial [Turicimonas muris]
MKKILILLLLAASSFNSVFALDKPQSGREDKRVFYTDYKPDEIYPISAVNGLITTIIFEPGETVKNFGSGFSTAWEFAARENHFFLKPKEKQGTTNLVVVT